MGRNVPSTPGIRRRGTITGFASGVSVVVDDLGEARLRRLEIAENGRGVVLGTVFGATGPGSPRLVRPHVHDNAGAGVAASGWRLDTTIREGRIRDNGGAGVSLQRLEPARRRSA